jgi:hypothetical protein
MNIVTIKFKPYFKEPLLSGVKVCTARTKRMGASGDRFMAFETWFEIKSVTEESLHFVADLWQQEGCTSREHFLEVWREIHPVVGYRPKQVVFLHRFKLVTK